MVAGAFQNSGLGQGLLPDQILQIARGGGAGGSGEAEIFLRTEASLEAGGSLPENAGEDFFLTFIKLSPQPVVEFGFLYQEIHGGLCLPIGVQGATGPAPDGGAPSVGSMMTLEALEREHIRRVVEATPTIQEAARVLGIDAATIYRKRRKAEGDPGGEAKA